MSWICFQIELPQNKEQWEQKVKEECDRMLTQEAHVFFVKYFSLKKASEFPFFSK